MHRRFAFGVAAAASVCTLLAGCGSSSPSSSGGGSNASSATPKTELTDAFHSLTAGSALTTTLSLDTTSANLVHITGEGGSTPLTTHQADLIAGAKIVIQNVAPSGKSLADVSAVGVSKGESLQVTGSSNGTSYFTLISTNQTIYAQVNLKDILAAAGQSSEYQTLVARTSSLPQFVQDFIAGKFVSISGSTISQLNSFIKGAVQGSTSQSIPDATQITVLVGQLESAVLANVTVTRTSTGSTDQLLITGNLREIARAVLSAIATAIPLAASQLNPAQANQVPDKDLKATASITDGAVSKLEFDFGQFSPHQQDSLPISATFTKSSPAISAPSGASEVNFQDLISLLTTIGTQSSTSSGSGNSGPLPVPSVVGSTAASQ